MILNLLSNLFGFPWSEVSQALSYKTQAESKIFHINPFLLVGAKLPLICSMHTHTLIFVKYLLCLVYRLIYLTNSDISISDMKSNVKSTPKKAPPSNAPKKSAAETSSTISSVASSVAKVIEPEVIFADLLDLPCFILTFLFF
jgi:hypothetical protein